MAHTIFIPDLGTMALCWYCDANGRCWAEEFYKANPRCQASFLARCRTLAARGTVLVREQGHHLRPPYEDIYELKPGRYRFFGFRDRHLFLVTNAAMKMPQLRQQEGDYRMALTLRTEYFAAAA